MIKSYKEYLKILENKNSNSIACQWINVHGEKDEKTYKDLYNDICKFVAHYSKSYVFKGKNIGIIGVNSYDYAVSVFGIIGLGGIVVPFNYLETKEEITQRLKDADIYAVFYDDVFVNKINDGECIKLNLLNYKTEIKAEEAKFVETDINEPAAMIFTSGTTGKSKCAKLSLKNIFTICDSYKELVESSSKVFQTTYTKLLFTPPFYHIFGLADLFYMLEDGITICLCGDLRKIDIAEEVFDFDSALVVPIILDKWVRDITLGKTIVSNKLKTLLYGGSFASKKTTNILLDNGINIIRAYGMTETCGIGINCLINNDTPDNLLGKPYKNIEVKIIDDEICFRGDSIMLGYYKNDNDNIIIDGWLHSGDLGYIKDDNVYISGRKKNIIILSGGENVNPEELEVKLQNCELIKEIRIKDDNGEICAEIYCDNKDQETIKKYISSSNKELPYFKRITKTTFREEPFKHTSSGKIIRK